MNSKLRAGCGILALLAVAACSSSSSENFDERLDALEGDYESFIETYDNETAQVINGAPADTVEMTGAFYVDLYEEVEEEYATVEALFDMTADFAEGDIYGETNGVRVFDDNYEEVALAGELDIDGEIGGPGQALFVLGAFGTLEGDDGMTAEAEIIFFEGEFYDHDGQLVAYSTEVDQGVRVFDGEDFVVFVAEDGELFAIEE